MQKHHAQIIAGSILCLAAAVQWTGAAIGGIRSEWELGLLATALITAIFGYRMLWYGSRPPE